MQTITSVDGTIKLCIDDYYAIVIPNDDKYTLCVSCQVGCPMSCVFCSSRKSFIHNLSAEAIYNQFDLAKRQFGVPHSIVFMGMGEPLLNLDSVLTAIDKIHATGYSRRRLTISTIGLPSLIRLIEAQPIYKIAISLHSPYDHIRKHLVPNSSLTVNQIVQLTHVYRQRHGVMIEYLLIRGITDRPEDLARLISLDWHNTIFNLIMLNPLGRSQMQDNQKLQEPLQESYAYANSQSVPSLFPSNMDTVLTFKQSLRDKGHKCFIRTPRGLDIDSACGMLSPGR